MRYLILKDLKQHKLVFSLYLMSCIIGPLFPLLIDVYVVHVHAGFMAESRNLFGISLLFTIVIPVVSGQLLISTEKSKGTMLALILLPVKRREIILSKEILGASIIFIALLINLGSMALTFRYLRGQWGYLPSVGVVFRIYAGLVLTMQTLMCMIIMFRERVAIQVAIIGVLCWRPVWAILMAHIGSPLKRWEDVFNNFGMFLLVGLILLMHYGATKSFIAHNWSVESIE